MSNSTTGKNGLILEDFQVKFSFHVSLQCTCDFLKVCFVDLFENIV